MILSLALSLPLALGALPLPDDDPAVEEAIEALKTALKDKQDDTAVATIDRLTVLARDAGPKDKKKIAKGVGETFGAKRVPREGESKDEVFRAFVAAAASLGQMGDEGVGPLVRALEQRSFRHEPALRAKILAALGATKSEKATKPLLDMLEDKDYDLIAAAADALGNYDKAPLPPRKEIVERLVRHLESAANAANPSSPQVDASEARRKYDRIGGPLLSTLAKLTGQDFRDPLEWVKWWNDNKKRPW
jgi:HEAT repeat protein